MRLPGFLRRLRYRFSHRYRAKLWDAYYAAVLEREAREARRDTAMLFPDP